MRAASYLEGRRKFLAEWSGLLARFISTLPDAGWEGPCIALEFALLSVKERFPDLSRAFVPRGTGLGRHMANSTADLTAMGWTCWIRRSRKTGRTFVFEKLTQSAT